MQLTEHAPIWAQDMVFGKKDDESLAVTGYFPDNPDGYTLEDGDALERVAVLGSGFLESRRHPGIVAVASALAGEGITAFTFDAAGLHDSNGETRRFSARQAMKDMAAIALFATKFRAAESLIFGGQSMGGVIAMRAAIAVARQSDVLPTHVFTVKTPHHPQAHEPFDAFKRREARAFFGFDANGVMVRRPPVRMEPGSFSEHEENGRLETLISELNNHARPPQVLLTASPEDLQMPLDPLNALAQELPNVGFAAVDGVHSDYSPAVAIRTATTITDWYQRSRL